MRNETCLKRPVFVTIEYARQKLGERGKSMSDKEIEKLLSTLRLMCNKVIDGVIENKHS